jgi:8-hydroxy-5-deazaflavin:NADPH oxidoreductase
MPVIAVIGGTGALGQGLARRWAGAGFPLVIGSRDANRAAAAAAAIETGAEGVPARGVANREAAMAADIIVLAVPFTTQAEIAQSISDVTAGKLVIDTTVPLMPPKLTHVQLPSADSAAVALRGYFGPTTRIVSAFHNIPARKLRGDTQIDCDVLVFGDDPADRQIGISLAEAAGMRGIHGGPLVNSTAAEALTSVLIGIGQIYKVDGAGIRITGLD